MMSTTKKVRSKIERAYHEACHLDRLAQRLHRLALASESARTPECRLLREQAQIIRQQAMRLGVIALVAARHNRS